MTIQRKVTAVLCASLLLAVTAAASQSEDGWMRKRATGLMIHRVERQLHLTDAQRSQIRGIVVAETPKIQAIAQQVREENMALQGQQTLDEANIRNIEQRHAAARADALVEREKVRFEILEVLTPEQRTLARQITQEMRGRFQDRLGDLSNLI